MSGEVFGLSPTDMLLWIAIGVLSVVVIALAFFINSKIKRKGERQ